MLVLHRSPGNEASEDATQCLNTQREGSHIQQEQVCDIPLHDTPLDGGSRGHHLIRVHTPRGLFLEQVLHNAAHLQQTASHAECCEDEEVSRFGPALGRHAEKHVK